MNTWLMKSEPDECGIDDFVAAPDTPIRWDGVRNYQARNFMQQMQLGDQVFLYHSSCKDIGIAGLIRVCRTAYPDPTQFDPESHYHDARSTQDKPRWQAVDLVLEKKFAALLPLEILKQLPELADCPLVKKGNRLSVMPISTTEAAAILAASKE
ncbi:EVE domain-containing protein [Marinospirillum alkaliphilum]|uniref:Predicted RNA-binding protein, contains PUA-like domain n=1 Tax=Marinospirillum alkaliphilum DSM 21637 TaxID=1122209 RepID=A0A1K2A1C4_9GAMM|nr:EVE domain-containing protein [Marinospirillum alkaliphilum]SFX79851.1 Predicted RNA-binding protein, contains PUA-like domain [Marinospirillum alkaliphilum DSM 21637]